MIAGIAGVGTDIIEIRRVAKACARPGFLNRIYTLAEQELIKGQASRAAGNFAVKEAVVKAFGTGFGKIRPQQVEVLRDQAGKPYVNLYGEAGRQAEAMGIRHIHVSISNEKEYAIAFAVAESLGLPESGPGFHCN